jgi:tetratricopeptide (TPR) repeat protein
VNDILKRGAMLHADIEMLVARSGASASGNRPGSGGTTLFMNDGEQVGLANTVNHWSLGRRLLDRVYPSDGKNGYRTSFPDPGADDTVRRWYLAGGAFMLSTRFIQMDHFSRMLRLFPNDPDVLFLVGSAHEFVAGARTQSVLRTMKVPRGVTFDILGESSELRLAEELYMRALEQNPRHLEARIRLGRVLGLRGRHDEAVRQLRQGLTAEEAVLRFYAHLFLGREFEAQGNGLEARRSYERAVALAPTAQSPLLGLSRVADAAGDRTAARELVGRVLALPPDDKERADPWWVYEIAPARGVDALVADVRQRIARLPR